MSNSACHTTGSDRGAKRAPWVDDPRASDKDALLSYTVENPEGTPVIVAVRAVLATDATPGDADHRLALRFYRSNPDFFKIDRCDGLLWVWPRTPAFTCPTNKHSPKHPEGDGAGSDTPQSPKETVRRTLEGRQAIKTDAERGLLLDALATYRETTEDRFHRLDRVRGDGPKHLLVPYSTRFNSSKRVTESRERLESAFTTASEQYNQAVVITLTTDPSRFESLLQAGESLLEDVSRFKSWIASDGRLGSRPSSIVVPEFTEKGIPHAHVVLFGVSWVVPHTELSAYWSASRDRGEVVWFDRLESRCEGGRWQWSSGSPEDGCGRPPRSYLSKEFDRLTELATNAPSAVRSAAGALRSNNREHTKTDAENGQGWWRLAMYWALEMSLFTASPCLKSDAGADDALPHVSRYEYVGTAQLGEFPGYVRERAVILARKGSHGSATVTGGDQ